MEQGLWTLVPRIQIPDSVKKAAFYNGHPFSRRTNYQREVFEAMKSSVKELEDFSSWRVQHSSGVVLKELFWKFHYPKSNDFDEYFYFIIGTKKTLLKCIFHWHLIRRKRRLQLEESVLWAACWIPPLGCGIILQTSYAIRTAIVAMLIEAIEMQGRVGISFRASGRKRLIEISWHWRIGDF